MNIYSKSKYPASALSNFAAHPFEFRGIPVTSMEGFLQGLKFKNPEMQKYVFTLAGIKAKNKDRHKKWWKTQTLWFQGKEIARESEEYQELLDEAYLALFSQNKPARRALLATRDSVLTHSIGRKNPKETVLTEREFVSRLMEVREKLSGV